ncbi:MAG: hypothetical protein R3362_01815 [Rhodothermales bacterium]|nr:hypothetical protein [Rhodothermales bacterium]
MRPLRHTVVQRLFGTVLVLSLVLGLAAPATAAQRAGALDAKVPAGMAAAFEAALADAVSAPQGPEAFAAALEAALAAQPDGDALVRFLEEGDSALLTLLYGQLLRALTPQNGLAAAPAPAPPSTTAAPLAPSPAPVAASVADGGWGDVRIHPVERRVIVPLAALSAAQPLGP